jgi:glyoxylase-like metal-dependent hydrolase (beta-lactamase superfamily II)
MPTTPPGAAFAALRAPVDPRTAWSLPAPGTLPSLTALDELVTRVLAPNASSMTLDGTNTYVVGAPGSGEAALVDPGPTDAEHLRRVREVLTARDAACRWILVTHRHLDHSAAARPWAAELGARVVARSADVAGPGGRTVGPGDRVELAGAPVEVVPTPGHTEDHVAFRLPNGVVLAGDHVLGRGTSVVTHPEGDLTAYLESLRRVRDLGPDALYPGHGPELREDPTAVLDYYLAHRRFREQQVLALLEPGAGVAVGTLVARIYHDVDRRLWPSAEQSTRAALEKLRREGALVVEGDRVTRRSPGAASPR